LRASAITPRRSQLSLRSRLLRPSHRCVYVHVVLPLALPCQIAVTLMRAIVNFIGLADDIARRVNQVSIVFPETYRARALYRARRVVWPYSGCPVDADVHRAAPQPASPEVAVVSVARARSVTSCAVASSLVIGRVRNVCAGGHVICRCSRSRPPTIPPQRRHCRHRRHCLCRCCNLRLSSPVAVRRSMK
jgi:hypothetical protein